MPELPEVETTRRGIAPWVEGQKVKAVIIRQKALRWPVPDALTQELKGQVIDKVKRRGKYLLLEAAKGTVLIHLGMSGSLRLVKAGDEIRKHDHVDIELANKRILRFHDPRRFGCMLWHKGDAAEHPLLAQLGPEPLSAKLSSEYLFTQSRKRMTPVKSFIMDSHVIVGVGNIYANEALFLAGILPTRKAGTLTRKQCERLTGAIKAILASAIAAGGTTLRDFIGGDGKPGYFKQSLHVYGRGGEACSKCGAVLIEIRQGQRSTVYCPKCQR